MNGKKMSQKTVNNTSKKNPRKKLNEMIHNEEIKWQQTHKKQSADLVKQETLLFCPRL